MATAPPITKKAAKAERPGARSRLRWPPGVSRSMAALAFVTGLLTLYGLAFDRSIREDPFGEPRDALEWLTVRQPSSALATIPVIPMGAYGELSWRPAETRWLTAARGPTPWAPGRLDLLPASCGQGRDLYCDVSTATLASPDVALTAGAEAPPILIRAAFIDAQPSKAPQQTPAQSAAPPYAPEPQASNPANPRPNAPRRSPRKQAPGGVAETVAKAQPAAPPVVARPPPVLLDKASLVTPAVQVLGAGSGAPTLWAACSNDGVACAAGGADGGLRYTLNSARSFYRAFGLVQALPSPILVKSETSRYDVIVAAAATPPVAALPVGIRFLAGRAQDDRQRAVFGETRRVAGRVLHSGEPDPMSRLLEAEPRLLTLVTRTVCQTFDDADAPPMVPGETLCLALFDGGQVLRFHARSFDEPEAAYIRLPTRAQLNSVLMLDRDRGYVSTIWRSETPLPAPLQRFEAAMGRQITLGDVGARHPPEIFETTNGGVSWKRLSYAAAPAPWVYFAAPLFLLSFAGVVGGLMRREDAGDGGIRLAGTSDTPIGWADADPLKLKPTARALSRFVRNAQTKPPLTIAISGVWGSGKSSLMNLIYEDLKDRRVRPVWFNAWHHQKEEQLFAALLENVRRQATPPIWTVSGLNYRLRLLRHRQDDIIRAVFVGALAAGAAMLAVQLGVSFSDKATFTSLLGSLQLPAGVVSFVGGAAVLMSRLGMTPAVLTKLGGAASVGELSGMLSFRHKFAEAFRDAAKTLRVGSDAGLVIFIDDLDRCRPENLMEIFEAVNFLTTAGPCFIFLGMDERRVIEAIASQPPISTVAARRREFSGRDADDEAELQARLYLRKLINVTVAVPEATETASLGLIDSKPPEAVSPWPARLRRWVRAAPDVVAPAAVAGLLLVWAALSLPDLLVGAPAAKPAEATTATNAAPKPAASAEPAPQNPASASTAASPTTPGEPASAPVAPPKPIPAAAPDWLIGLLIFGPLALAVLLPALALLRRAVVVAHDNEEDSEAFLSALRIWHRLVYAVDPTPRGVKRHQNRLRLQAMRLRPLAERRDWLDWAFRVPRAEAEVSIRIPDAQLVALAALDEADPALLDDIVDGRIESEGPLAGVAATSLEEFRARFGSDPGIWPPTAAQLERFRLLEQGVTTEAGSAPDTEPRAEAIGLPVPTVR